MNRFGLYVVLFCLFSVVTSSCKGKTSERQLQIVEMQDSTIVVVEPELKDANLIRKSNEALRLEKLGLVNVAELDSSFTIKLMYATPDNFTKQILYDSLQEAYLQPDVAEMLVKAQQILKKDHPTFSIIIYDAARPLHCQKKMWDIVKGTPLNIYVSNPVKTGLHNYGAAVDISLIDSGGAALDMGVPFDFFGPESHIDKEDMLIKEGKLTREQVNNRIILRKVMKEAGFKPLRTEWWHFNACNREEAKKRYKVIQ